MRRRNRGGDTDDDSNNSNSKIKTSTANTTITRDEEDDEEEESTSALISEARKRTKLTNTGKFGTSNSESNNSDNKNKTLSSVMHQYATSSTDIRQRNADLVTSTVELHPEQNQRESNKTSGTAGVGADGIFRDNTRSKLLAGPIKVTTSIRTTARFDYQPDICKDYKDTGFCGFGDTCIYLHDRGDTLTGWQLEEQWEEEQKRKKEQQEREFQGFLDGKGINANNDNHDAGQKKVAAITADDGLPYACHICRRPFTDPVVTACGHYFCESCIMDRVRNESETCPICSKDTHGVFNQPTKLINKKRKILGLAASQKDNSWEEYAKAFSSKEEPSS